VTIGKQHMISATLLRKWKPLVAINLRTRTSRQRSPESEGYIRHFVRAEYSDVLEKLWAETENSLNNALPLVVDGTVFEHDEALDTLHAMIALHFVRSGRSARIATSWWESAPPDSPLSDLRAVANEPNLMALHYQYRTGRIATSEDEIGEERARFLTALDHDFGIGGRSFVEEIEAQYNRVLSFVRSQPLQIGVVVGGCELVLSDTPVVTLDTATNTVGVPIAQANLVVMPIGPKCVVALGGTPGFVELDDEAVTRINRIEVLGAFEKVYVRDGSGLNNWVLSERLSPTPTSPRAIG
jgi:hypothetical protein